MVVSGGGFNTCAPLEWVCTGEAPCGKEERKVDSFLAATKADQMYYHVGGAISNECDDILSMQAMMYLQTSSSQYREP